MNIKIEEIARLLGGEIIGNAGETVSGISDLKGAATNDISFILAPKFLKSAEISLARVIISDSLDAINGKTIIKVKNAKIAYVSVINMFYPQNKILAYISPKASVAADVKIGKDVFIDDFAVVKSGTIINDNVYIGAGTIIGESCIIGGRTRINAGVVLYHKTEIGNDCIIYSGTVIGADGFGFVEHEGSFLKIPQIGNVIIGNNVEVGSNCCIDRAAFGATRLGNNIKIDNLVHIAHNVEVGDGTLIVGQAGVSGSTKIGKKCIIGGQTGLTDHISIGDGAIIGSQSGVASDVEPGVLLSGTPARPLLKLRKAEAYSMKLEDLFKRVKTLEADKK